MKSRETTGRQDPKIRILSILKGFLWKTKNTEKNWLILKAKKIYLRRLGLVCDHLDLSTLNS